MPRDNCGYSALMVRQFEVAETRKIDCEARAGNGSRANNGAAVACLSAPKSRRQLVRQMLRQELQAPRKHWLSQDRWCTGGTAHSNNREVIRVRDPSMASASTKDVMIRSPLLPPAGSQAHGSIITLVMDGP